MEKFRVLFVDQDGEETKTMVKTITTGDLPDGDVLIEVHYSSVNYKDGLAVIPNGGVVRAYPMVPGIDLAGVVLESEDARFQKGDEVLITGYDLGVSHYGGYSEVARVPGDWIVPLPEGLTLKEAMAIGTAGFTAALSIYELERKGMKRENGAVLVTGATGGVGSLAVSMLKKLGYTVTASTRKTDMHDYVKKLGAEEVISPEDLTNPKNKALLKQRWQAAVDPVAGDYLPVILASIKYGGSVAVSGLTGGNKFTSTVFPFILRGVSLLGIDSVFCPMETRRKIWERLAGDMKPEHLLDSIAREVTLDELPDVFREILGGKMKGRAIVKLK